MKGLIELLIKIIELVKILWPTLKTVFPNKKDICELKKLIKTGLTEQEFEILYLFVRTQTTYISKDTAEFFEPGLFDNYLYRDFLRSMARRNIIEYDSAEESISISGHMKTWLNNNWNQIRCSVAKKRKEQEPQ